MDSEGQRAKKMVQNLSFKEKVEHFWYYYKKHVFVGLFVALVVAFGVAQCVMKETFDLNIAYYSSRGIEQTVVDSFGDILEPLIEDIDGDGVASVFMPAYIGDITEQRMDEQAMAMLNKIPLELAADEFQMYILDKPYMELFDEVYSDIIQNKICISDIPEIKEALMLYDWEEVYLVMTTEFEQSKNDKKKIAERENAALVEAYVLEMKKD